MQYELGVMLFKFHEERPCFTTKIDIVIRDDIEYKKLVEQVLCQEEIDTLRLQKGLHRCNVIIGYCNSSYGGRNSLCGGGVHL